MDKWRLRGRFTERLLVGAQPPFAHFRHLLGDDPDETHCVRRASTPWFSLTTKLVSGAFFSWEAASTAPGCNSDRTPPFPQRAYSSWRVQAARQRFEEAPVLRGKAVGEFGNLHLALQ
jgi:hypothetical protein